MIAMATQKLEQSFGIKDRPAPPTRSSEIRETYDVRLNHILTSATRLIARDGYEKASMRAVAREAGVSLAGLYHYFESKERMLFLIQFRTFSSLLNNLREKLTGVDDVIEQLRVMIRSHVLHFATNMDALKVCSHELDVLNGSPYDETLRIRREYYQITRDIVDGVFARFNPESTIDRHVATMALFGMLNWLYRWYSPAQGRSPSGLAKLITGVFLNGVAGGNVPESNSNGPPAPA